MQGEAVPVVLN